MPSVTRSFPGTSVIQTRARYFCFVAWQFRAGERLRKSGPELLRWVNQQERRLIDTFLKAGETDGLVGRRAGVSVKILPSRIYWSALERYGILARPTAPDGIALASKLGLAEADELAERYQGTWHPTMPEPPNGFPDTVPGYFRLTSAEAGWLSERVISAAPGTFLAHLIDAQALPDPRLGRPVDDPAAKRANGAIQDLIEQARLFSLAIHGAALLYNLLLCDYYKAAGFNAFEAPTDDVSGTARRLGRRHRRFGRRLRCLGPCRFLGSSTEPQHKDLTAHPLLCRRLAQPRAAAANSPTSSTTTSLRELIKDREQAQKGSQSRFTNTRLLAAWSGASGASRLVFRWPQVRVFVTDLLDPAEA